MEERTKKEHMITDADELEKAAGGTAGGCWFGARFVAPDGHDVGCEVSWYRVQFSDREFCEKFPAICPTDGKPHDTAGRHYCGSGQYLLKCSRCGHFVNKDGTYNSGWGVLAD